MPTYATAAEVRTYTDVASLDALGDSEIEKLIDKAERDLDGAVGVYPVNEDTGLKFDPLTLTAGDARSVMLATCAQVEYRHVMGAEFFIRAQHENVDGPEFKTVGKLPYIGPEVWKELEQGGILHLTTSWAPSGGIAPPWDSFARNVGDVDAPDPVLRGTISTP